MLFVGCFLEPTAAITILVPVLMPVVQQLGIDPVHFGLVMVLNLMIGLLHPPMGMVLFVLARVANLSVEKTTMAILPWLVPLLAQPDPHHLHPVDLAVAAASFLLMNSSPELRSKHSAPSCGAPENAMLTKTSLTIRLHANDDVVIARQQLVSGTTLIDEKVAVSGLVPPGHKIATRAHRGRRAGEALQPDHRLRQAPDRPGRARSSAQPGDGRVQPRLRVRRRCQADAVRRRPRDLPGHRARGGSTRAAWRPATTSGSCRR